MRIGVDLDGVVYDWEATARFLLKDQFGVDVTPSERWDWIEDHVTKDQWEWLWGEGIKRGLFLHGDVYNGAIEAIRKLDARGDDIVIITSRPKSVREDTLNWLAHHRIPTGEVHILYKNEPKSSVECDVYIEDGPHNIADLARNTAGRVLMMDRPWNSAVTTGARITRVHGWEDVLKIA